MIAVLFWIGDIISTVRAPVVEALSTLAVAVFTAVLVWIGRRADKHFRVTERAYIKMSHKTPKPDEFGQAFNWGTTVDPATQDIVETVIFGFSYEVRNHGRTPAKVTALGTDWEVLDDGEKWSLPDDYWDPLAEIDRSEAFLVCDDKFTTSADGEVSEEDKKAIKGGKKILIVVGFVDYIDQFDVRHRSGYARQLVPGDRDKNNLMFPDEYPGLNYDRVRVRGEGLDWD